jgi:hypothetical protein
MVPSVFTSLENVRANKESSSTNLHTVIPLKRICFIFFQDHTWLSEEPKAIIRVGSNALSGFLIYATYTLVFSSLSKSSKWLVIKICLYFSEFIIRYFDLLKCSYACTWVWAIINMSNPFALVKAIWKFSSKPKLIF